MKQQAVSVIMCLAVAVVLCGCSGGSSDSGQVIERLTIAVDGDTSDWGPTAKPLARDPAGDAVPNTGGGDITLVSMAYDDQNLYALVEFSGAVPTGKTILLIEFSRTKGSDFLNAVQVDDAKTCMVLMGNGAGIGAYGVVAVAGSTMELSVPIQFFNFAVDNYISVNTQVLGGTTVDVVGGDPIRIIL